MSLNITVKEITEILKSSDFQPQLPIFSREKLWAKIGERDLSEDIVARADSICQEPLPDIRFSDYQEFNKSGDRKAYQNPANQKKRNLKTLVIAEGIVRKGDYRAEINDYIWSFCEETAWVMSAHLSHYDVDVPFKGYDYIDLGVVARAQLLSEVAFIMDGFLPSEIEERINQELENRVFRPFLRYNDFWWMSGRNNWNSVCHSGVINSAILQDIPANRLARMLKKTLNDLPKYMESFDQDGCTSEGVGYWNYGFGNFAEMADLVYRRTDGEINFFELDEKIPEIVEFPLNVELSPGKFPNFADSSEENSFSPYLIHTLADYFAKPELYSLLKESDYEKVSFRNLAVTERKYDTQFKRKKRVFFSGFQWFISRVRENDEDSLVLALKGGHNAEDHNHNDCGSFIVHIGGESLITDLGSPPYTRKTFSEERYTILACRSRGHNVPLVNGYEQKTGSKYQAKLLDKSFGEVEDKIVFDLKDLYPKEAGLNRLEREFVINKEHNGFVTVQDKFEFSLQQPGTMIEHFYSFNKIMKEKNHFEVQGEKYDLNIEIKGQVETEVEHIKNAVGSQKVYRLQLTLSQIDQGEVKVSFIPK